MKKKLKVMILHNIISPYRNPLFEELSKKYDLTVYFCKENDAERKWSTKLEGYSFNYNVLPHKQIGPFVINTSLKEELKEKEFDVYILPENPENAFSIKKVVSQAKKNNKKIILWNERISDEILSLKKLEDSKNIFEKIIYLFLKKGYKVYRRNLYNKADRFISFSEGSSKLLLNNEINKKMITRTYQIMPKSILTKPTWKEKPKEFKDKKIILYIGYLNEYKGVQYLIEAFKELKRNNIILLIAGTGNQEEKLKELAKDNKNIIFLGYKEGADKANYYSIADFFVFPTLYDVWGLVVNEALYYGIPVITTNKAEAKELIEEGKTGFIIPDKDPDALAEAMRKLLDYSTLKKMRRNIKKIIPFKICNIQMTVKSFEDAINILIYNKKKWY